MSISLDAGLLVLRVVLGLTIAGHGAQKLFGWFGGPGFNKLAQGFTMQGFRPAPFWVSLVILGELGGGISIALGFLTPLGAASVVGAMTMAIFKTHWKNGFWNSNRGLEFPLALLGMAAGIGLMGPGSYSLDALLGIRLAGTPLFFVLTAAALLVDIVGLRISRAPVAAPVAASARPS